MAAQVGPGKPNTGDDSAELRLKWFK